MEPPRPSLWQLARVWLALGVQSFGGGTATLFLIRRAVVEQQRWLTPEQFTRDWALCFMAPGINLLCMTILVGWRLAGLAGALISLAGLLLPSVSITIVMIALYADVRQLPVIQSALRGVVPATVGLGLLLSISNVRPLLVASRREGRASFAVSMALLAASFGAALVWQLPVIVVLCSAGAISGLALWWRSAAEAGRR